MAQLNDLIVNGKLRLTETLYLKTFNLNGTTVTLNSTAISSVIAGNTAGSGLCTADQVKTYITGLTS